MVLDRVEEYRLGEPTRKDIGRLLQLCFSQYPVNRIFISQLPDFRFLWYAENGELCGHLAVEHRIVNNEGNVFRIFGAVDLCVHPAFQKQGIGTLLLRSLETLGQENGVEFVLLATADQDWFAKRGYSPIEGNCRWIMIHENISLGIAARWLGQTLMVKPLGEKVWQEGSIDFLGHIF